MQGVLGWYMVKSGLDEQIITDKAVPRVSQYRLAAHLSAALALYVGMLYTAIGLRRDVKMTAAIRNGGSISTLNSVLANPTIKKYRGLVHLAAAMVFFTAVSGAFVAGLDAGLVYNEFPTMGGRLVPPTDELLDTRYAKRSDKGDNWWRNMLENPVTAQFDHRLFATTTFAVLLSLPLIARSKSLRLASLPQNVRRWANLTAAAAIGQVTLGITTLLYLVPVPLAATHQAGSVVLLTCLMGLMGSLRKPGKLVQALQRHMSKSTKLQ
jgi:cytochrome c oxidase assembly protein subunit 15